MDYFLALIVSGLLSGPVYAVVGLALVVVYRASGVLNFSLGEWVGIGARVSGVGVAGMGLPLLIAALAAGAVMAILARLFSFVVVKRLLGRPVIAIVMATLALGVLMQGGSAIALRGLPQELPPLFDDAVWRIGDIPAPPARLLASAVAILLALAVMAFFRFSRAGVALRAIADDPGAAAGVGVDAPRYLALAWMISAGLAVAGGVLWSIDGLGGFGMALVLAKVLPVAVIGGLSSFGGVFVGAAAVGLAESLAAGYLDPLIGAGSSALVGSALVIAMLWARPTGIFGQGRIERV